MKRFLLVLVCLTFLTAALNADGYCRSYYPSYYYPKVVKEVIREKVVPVLRYVDINLFSANYSPVAFQAQYSANFAQSNYSYNVQPLALLPAIPVAPVVTPVAAHAKALTCEEKLEAFKVELRAELRSMREGSYSNVNGNGGTVRGGNVFQNRCASCHSPGNAGKGKGLVLFKEDGSPDDWDSEIREAILAEISSRRMPKGSKLSQEELNEAGEILEGMRPKLIGGERLKVRPRENVKPPNGDGNGVEPPARAKPPSEKGNGGL